MSIKTRYLQSFLLYVFVVTLCIPGKLRYSRGSFHFGGAELAIVPFFIPLFVWLVASVIVSRSPRIKVDTPTTVVLAFLGFQTLLIPFATQPYWAILELIRLFICTIVFFLFAKWLNSELGLRAFGASIITVVMLQAAAAVTQALTGVTVSGLDLQQSELNVVSASSYRLVGTLGHPGTLAQFLTILLPMMVFSVTKYGKSVPGLLTLIAIPVLIIFTQSRTGIVILAVSLWVLILSSSRNVKKAKIKLLYVFGSLVTMFAVFGVLWSTVIARFIQDPSESAEARELIAGTALNMITAHPVAGVGLNNFTEVMRIYDTSGITLTFPYPVHNIYLLITAETGLVGLFSFLLLNTYFIAMAIKNMRHSRDSAFNSLSFFALISLGVVYTTGLLGWAWRQDSIQCLYWISLAAITADNRSRAIVNDETGHQCY